MKHKIDRDASGAFLCPYCGHYHDEGEAPGTGDGAGFYDGEEAEQRCRGCRKNFRIVARVTFDTECTDRNHDWHDCTAIVPMQECRICGKKRRKPEPKKRNRKGEFNG